MIKVRKATLKDIPVIFRLWKSLVKEHNAMILQKSPRFKPVLKAKKNIAQIYKKDAKRVIASKEGIIFIAETEKKPVGYIELTINKGNYSKIKGGTICDIFVMKEFRKLGASSKLKEEAIKWFKSKKVKYVWISVNKYNKHANLIYKKWGFSDTDIRMMRKI